MIQGLLTALGTTAGKVSMGVALTAAAASGAVAADVVEVPGTDEVPTQAEVEVDDQGVVESDTDTDPGPVAGEAAESGPTDDAETTDDTSDEDGEDESVEEERENHGRTVSEFARTTDLVGCEKGQAISEIASSKSADRRKNPERDHDPCDHDDEDDESEPEVASAEDDADPDDESNLESDDADENDDAEDDGADEIGEDDEDGPGRGRALGRNRG